MSAVLDSIGIGQKLDIGSHTFERNEIIAFAQQFDPQPFHLNEDAAKASLFKALCASGWHVVSVWMRLNVEYRTRERAELAKTGGKPVIFGPSPGVRNLRWSHPVYPGDTITYTDILTGKRETPKRPGWGMVMTESSGVNQNGKLVCRMEGAVTVQI